MQTPTLVAARSLAPTDPSSKTKFSTLSGTEKEVRYAMLAARYKEAVKVLKAVTATSAKQKTEIESYL